MAQQLKSVPYSQILLKKCKQNRQYEILKEEYERIDVLDDRKINVRVREVRLEQLKRKIEKINNIHLKRRRLNSERESCGKNYGNLEKNYKSKKGMLRSSGVNLNTNSFKIESKNMFTNRLARKTICQNLEIGPTNNSYSSVLTLSDNVHFVDLGTMIPQELGISGSSGTSIFGLPKTHEKRSRAAKNWRKLATCVTRSANLSEQIGGQIKTGESSFSKLSATSDSEIKSHPLKNKRLHTYQAEAADDQILKIKYNPNQLTKLIERNDFDNSFKIDSAQRDTLAVGKLRQIFEHHNQL